MAFDVAGARKAGYSDAEIAAHLAQLNDFDLAGAKSARYSDSEIIAHLKDRPGKAQIPITADPAQDAALRQRLAAEGDAKRMAEENRTIGEKVVGAGEAALTFATGATGGTLGTLAGTLKGLAEQILSGQFGTKEAADLVEKSAMGGAQALTYQPRTAAGQDAAEAVGKVAQNLAPLAGVAPGMIPPGVMPRGTPVGVVARAGAEGVARDVAGPGAAAAVAKAADVTSRATGVAKSTVTTLPRRALDALSKPPEPTPTPGTMGSVGGAGTDMATQRVVAAESLGFTGDAALTRGQRTRDAAQLKFEVEASKMPAEGARLRQRAVAQNQQILRTFDNMVDQTGAEAPTLRAVGQAVDKALVEQAARDKTAIRAAYKNAEKAGEMEAPVALQSVIQHLNESAPEAATAPLLNVARAKALQLGLATDEGGQLVARPVPLKTVESFRQAIGRSTDFEATNVRQSTIIKGLVDEATEGLGGDLYKQARKMRARYAQNYEDRAAIANLLETKRGTSDRRVALEDVFDHTVLRGSLDDVRNVRRVLQRSGAGGEQAWRELQGATANWIKNEATKNVATDSAGNSVVSAAGLDKAIRGLDVDGRLDFIFGKKGAQQMRDLNELAKYVKTVPPEAAINTSNTVATLLAAFGDIAISGASGIPAPVATGARLAIRQIKDQRLRRRISDALDEAERKQAPNNKPGEAVSLPRRGETLH